MNYIYEIKALIEDCRAEVVGGIIAGLEIWEVTVIPYLMNNSDTSPRCPRQPAEPIPEKSFGNP